MINTEELKQKLYHRLIPSGWANILKTFLLSSDMDLILNQLYKESQEGKHWTPKLKQVFRFLEECPYEKLKCVLVLQSPYPHLSNKISGVTVSDGIPMSCGNDYVLQASLKYVHGEIRDTVYKDRPWDPPYDLKVWANQGVLLLNVAWTTTIGRTDSHYELWRPMVNFLMDYLSWQNGGLIWVFMGKVSQGYMGGINDGHYKLICSHPASAAYLRAERWSSGVPSVWEKVNSKLIENGKDPIIW